MHPERKRRRYCCAKGDLNAVVGAMKIARFWCLGLIVAVCVSCKNSDPPLKSLGPATLPSGWKLIDIPGAPITFGAPAEMNAEPVEASVLNQALPANAKAKSLHPGIRALGNSDQMRMVSAYTITGEENPNTKDFLQGLRDGLAKTSAIQLGDPKIVGIPVGTAHVMESESVVQGTEMYVVMYVIFEKNHAHSIMILDATPDARKVQFASKVAKTIRVRMV